MEKRVLYQCYPCLKYLGGAGFGNPNLPWYAQAIKMEDAPLFCVSPTGDREEKAKAESSN